MTTLQDIKLNVAYLATTKGNITFALRLFRSILQDISLVEECQQEVDDLVEVPWEVLGIARCYILALTIELKRREETDNPARQNELAAYFTHFNLQPIHMKITLKSAMNISYELHNFNTAALFARRLLDLNLSDADALNTRTFIRACEMRDWDAMPLNYDPSMEFSVCGSTLTPIYRGCESVSCPFCAVSFMPQIRGQVCPICELATVGTHP